MNGRISGYNYIYIYLVDRRISERRKIPEVVTPFYIVSWYINWVTTSWTHSSSLQTHDPGCNQAESIGAYPEDIRNTSCQDDTGYPWSQYQWLFSAHSLFYILFYIKIIIKDSSWTLMVITFFCVQKCFHVIRFQFVTHSVIKLQKMLFCYLS